MHCNFDFHFAKSLEKFILESDWLQGRIEINFYIAIMHPPSYPILSLVNFQDGSILETISKQDKVLTNDKQVDKT